MRMGSGEARARNGLGDYVSIMRLDHSVKHIFIVPGVALAWLLRDGGEASLLSIGLGLFVAVAIASANYVINEYLDREFDRLHPTKSARAAVQRELSAALVFGLWAVLVTAGVGLAALASRTLAVVAMLFALQGVVYNVRPLRTKDKPYLDVLSESVNNPLRLMIGWAMVDPTTLPPSSILLAYWLGGAFLMAAKRFSEYREIVAAQGRDLLVRYRASFAGYDETSLLISCFVYALLANFFLAVFLIKYRIEYLLTMPAVTALFAQYLALSFRAGSSAQAPEKLYRERGLMALVALLAVVFLAATVFDVPLLKMFVEQRYISLG